MAKRNRDQQKVQSVKPKVSPDDRRIPFAAVWLGLIVVLLYSASVSFDFTELDDIIFIREQADYNADLSNFAHSFQRGVFAEKADTYYRPLLLNSFVVNAQFSGTYIMGYHVFNILLHLLAVYLVYLLLMQLQIKQPTAFILSVLFAVHPVFVQAVTWIPGRNDTLLGIFIVAFLMQTLNYLHSQKVFSLIASGLWLLAALFTKESALVVPLAAWVLLLGLRRINIFARTSMILYTVWIAAVGIWFWVRSTAGLANEGLDVSAMGSQFFERLPVLVQYLGKAILPFNQSVFPMMEDTSYVFGVIALLLLSAAIYFSGSDQRRIWFGGVGWFIAMLLPVVLLPGSLNEQDFEHRLYVPFLGLLIAAGHASFFTVRRAYTVPSIIGVALLFIILNLRHQQLFKDPVTFWEAAVRTTPNSGYATMMLAARLDEVDKTRADALMLHAYRLDPDEKYINFYVGKYYLDQNRIDSASICLNRELEISAYYETWFQLSRLAFMQNDFVKSRGYMEKYLELNPSDAQASSNYILLLIQLQDAAAARQFVAKKQKQGMIFPQGLIDQIPK